MRIVSVESTGIPMPARVFGREGARLQGGLPPRAWRSATPRWGEGNRCANEPFVRRDVRMEVMAGKAAMQFVPR